MKFRKLFFTLIIAAVLACYFTKPSKEDFIKFIQPKVSRTQIPPVVDFEDKFLYSKVTATFVNAGNPIRENNKIVAPAGKEEYIGVFNRFWKLNK